MNIVVDTVRRTFRAGDLLATCAIGRSGAVAPEDKREGDGATPLGCWPIRGALLRRGAPFAPPPSLPWRWIRRDDGWCDDPSSTDYNRPISHPSVFSAERLQRDDGAYDAIVVIGHNDAPVVLGRGSAVFIHLLERGATAGCVAIEHDAMRFLLANATASSVLEII